jgi:plastin-1
MLREVQQSVGESGFTHSFLVEERICFAKLVNDILNGDEDVKGIIPVDPETDDIFHSLSDGIVLAKLINAAAENTIDFRAVNRKKQMNIY